MRLDKFLQVTGLIKRRTLANEACKRGLVKVNGQPAKPTRDIIADDEIAIDLPTRDLRVKVLREVTTSSLPKAKRPEYFTVLTDVRRATPDDDFWKDDEEA